MTVDARPPFYDGLVPDISTAMEAGRLVGLQEELQSLRAYVKRYAREHPDEFGKILQAMRLITQMVLAQHRVGAEQFDKSIEALERVSKELRDAFGAPPEEEDI